MNAAWLLGQANELGMVLCTFRLVKKNFSVAFVLYFLKVMFLFVAVREIDIGLIKSSEKGSDLILGSIFKGEF